MTDEISYIDVDSKIPIKIDSYGWIGDIFIKPIYIAEGSYHIYIDFNHKKVELLATGSNPSEKYNSNLTFQSNDQYIEIQFNFPESGNFIGNVNLHKDGFHSMFYTDSTYSKMMKFLDNKDIKLGQ